MCLLHHLLHPPLPTSTSGAPLHQPDISHEKQLPVMQAMDLAQLWVKLDPILQNPSCKQVHL